MNSTIMARQKPIDTTLSDHGNQPGDQGSVFSAPGYEVDESEEGASENDIANNIKGSNLHLALNMVGMQMNPHFCKLLGLAMIL